LVTKNGIGFDEFSFFTLDKEAVAAGVDDDRVIKGEENEFVSRLEAVETAEVVEEDEVGEVAIVFKSNTGVIVTSLNGVGDFSRHVGGREELIEVHLTEDTAGFNSGIGTCVVIGNELEFFASFIVVVTGEVLGGLREGGVGEDVLDVVVGTRKDADDDKGSDEFDDLGEGHGRDYDYWLMYNQFNLSNFLKVLKIWSTALFFVLFVASCLMGAEPTELREWRAKSGHVVKAVVIKVEGA